MIIYITFKDNKRMPLVVTLSDSGELTIYNTRNNYKNIVNKIEADKNTCFCFGEENKLIYSINNQVFIYDIKKCKKINSIIIEGSNIISIKYDRIRKYIIITFNNRRDIYDSKLKFIESKDDDIKDIVVDMNGFTNYIKNNIIYYHIGPNGRVLSTYSNNYNEIFEQIFIDRKTGLYYVVTNYRNSKRYLRDIIHDISYDVSDVQLVHDKNIYYLKDGIIRILNVKNKNETIEEDYSRFDDTQKIIKFSYEI